MAERRGVLPQEATHGKHVGSPLVRVAPGPVDEERDLHGMCYFCRSPRCSLLSLDAGGFDCATLGILSSSIGCIRGDSDVSPLKAWPSVPQSLGRGGDPRMQRNGPRALGLLRTRGRCSTRERPSWCWVRAPSTPLPTSSPSPRSIWRCARSRWVLSALSSRTCRGRSRRGCPGSTTCSWRSSTRLLR